MRSKSDRDTRGELRRTKQRERDTGDGRSSPEKRQHGRGSRHTPSAFAGCFEAGRRYVR